MVFASNVFVSDKFGGFASYSTIGINTDNSVNLTILFRVVGADNIPLFIFDENVKDALFITVCLHLSNNGLVGWHVHNS